MDQTLILDISSDDDVGFDDSSTADNFDWISKLLHDDDDNDLPSQDSNNHLNSHSNSGVTNSNNSALVDNHDGKLDDDEDDVVVVGETIVNHKRLKKISVTKCRDLDDDDDDCVVLEGDPDKVNDKSSEKKEDGFKGSQDAAVVDDDEDLLIVSEKGQVACRDYPHSRHLCAKFPFSTTSHDSRCDMCHCYVCDSPAPCAYWGSGVSSIDHCHATDKEEYWQLERKRVRHSKNSLAPTSKPPVAAVAGLLRLQQTSSRAHPVARPPSACGVSSPFGVPNIISQGRSQRPSSITVPRNRFQPHLVSRQLLRSCNSNPQTTRSSTLAPSLVSSRPSFKRSGCMGRAGVPNRSAYCPSNNVNVAYLPQMRHQVAGKHIQSSSTNLSGSSPHLGASLSPCQPTTGSISTGGLPSQLQGYSQPSPHTPTSHFQGYGIPAAVTSDSLYVYTSGNQNPNISSPNITHNSSNLPNSVTQSSQQASIITQNVSSPMPSCGTANVLSGITERRQQPSEAAHNYSSPNYPCNTSNSLSGVAPSYERPPAENSLVQGAVPLHDFSPSMEQNSQVYGSTNSTALDFDFDSWLQDDEPTLGAQDGSYMFDMNNQASAPGPVDAGMLYFDFETSWKGLAHS